MPRKKKTETVEAVEITEVVNKLEKDVCYGSGWNRVNNMLQAGFSIEEIREDKRNE